MQAITSCTLDPEEGAYVISVETPVHLDLVLLHSHVHMDLLESVDEDDLEQASTHLNKLKTQAVQIWSFKFELQVSDSTCVPFIPFNWLLPPIFLAKFLQYFFRVQSFDLC